MYLFALPVLSVLSDWIDRRATNIPEGGALPDRWIAWGAVVPLNARYPRFGYFQARLPSWRWLPLDGGNRHCWHRITVWWFEPKGWAVDWLPEYA